ncbi:hypothetical protein predicted by Glimmer/Critica [Sorangium cellulosum So ce56]|uniref:Helix-turn-helix domain-containing protein n=2 Tax=Sorangium cellulosum TaxID=56 RepID=A9EVH1_SORC5|nr:hypothetical protein predicted by Glimmer/Critica [Sorangium cellulosum So ce56]
MSGLVVKLRSFRRTRRRTVPGRSCGSCCSSEVSLRKAVSQDELSKAFATIARYLIDSMREVANENATGDTSPAFYDAKSCPMAPTTFRRAAATGAFPSFKIGRKLMARKADVDEWIATQARTPKPKEQSGDDADAAFFASLQPRRPRR